MSAGQRWIDQNLKSAPRQLLETMASAIPADPSADAPESLAMGAFSLYAKVLAGTGGREDALVLLAADALLTHAFQAQAEMDPARLEHFGGRFGSAALLAAMPVGDDRP